MVKAELPGIRSIFGGVHVSALREKVLEECRERELEMRELAYLLMDNFLGLVEE